ncbi:MAG: TonB-dependent receptor plug domain-containing protein [Rhodothermaceae bacterium]
MKNKIKILLVLISVSGGIFGQVADSLSIDDLFKMDLEELLNVKIRVSTSEATDVFRTPSTVTVIDQNQIKLFGFTTISEALRSIAGIDVMQTIIDRNVTTSRGVLQNFYANKILLMINNIPTYQPINGDGHLERVSLNDVERIEVLKGPASVLYGSNAYAGVVNIILRQNEKFSINGYGSVGYKNRFSSGINMIYNKKDFNMFISANNGSEEKNGYTMASKKGAYSNNDSTYTYYDNEYVNNFNALLKYKNHSLYLNTFRFDHSYLGAEPSYRSGANKLVKNSGTLVNYKFEQNMDEKLRFNIDVTYDYFTRKLPLSQDYSNITVSTSDRVNSRFNLIYDYSGDIRLETGLSYELRMSCAQETRNGITDELIRINEEGQEDIYEVSAYAQLYYNLDDFRFSAGVRYTKNELFGDNVSLRFTGVYSLGNREAIKFIYGESFRAPTLLEMFFSHPTVVGNKQLSPEKSKSYELVYLKSIKNLYFQILGYYATYMDLIERYTDISGPPSKYRNASSLNGYGIEAEVKYNLQNNFNLFANYNYISGVNGGDEKVYKYVPDHNLAVGLSKKIGDFIFSGNLDFYSKTEGHLKKINPQVNATFNIGFNANLGDLATKHIISFKNIFNGDMLTPEYIRKTSNINALPTTGYGRRVIYSLYIYY